MRAGTKAIPEIKNLINIIRGSTHQSRTNSEKKNMSHKLSLEGESLRLILIIVIGWTAFSLADVNAKFLSERYEASVIITFTATINFILLSFWILKQRGLKGFVTTKWKLLALRGFLTGLTSFGVVSALGLIPIADLYGITFAAPFTSVVLATLLLKEQVGWHRWLAVIIGFIGVVVLVGPQYQTVNIGIIYAAMASICIALSTIVVRYIGTKEYMPLLIWYSCIGMLAVNLPFALPSLSIPATSDLLLFGINGFLILVAMLLTTYSLAHAKSTASVAPFVYIQAIWGLVFGMIFFDDTPTYATIGGLIIIVGAGLYMIYRERQLQRQ